MTTNKDHVIPLTEGREGGSDKEQEFRNERLKKRKELNIPWDEWKNGKRD